MAITVLSDCQAGVRLVRWRQTLGTRAGMATLVAQLPAWAFVNLIVVDVLLALLLLRKFF